MPEATAAAKPTKTERTIKAPRVQYREFQIRADQAMGGEDGQPKLYPLTFSSEKPVLRFSWETWDFYWEVLGHSAAEVDFGYATEGLPLIKSHDRREHFGSVRNVELDAKSKTLKGDAEFSSIDLGQQQETMVREKHIRTVSVGYEVLSLDLVSKPKDGYPTYRASWKPLEVSTTPIPADETVGFARDKAREHMQARAIPDVDLKEIPVTEPQGERGEESEPAPDPPQTKEGERTMPTEPTPTTAPAATAAAAPPATPASRTTEPPVVTRDYKAERNEITALANRHGRMGDLGAWFERDLTPAQVKDEILNAVATRGGGQPAAESLPGMPEKDKRRYSVARALRLQAEIKSGDRSGYDGVEAEVHKELIAKRGAAPANGGVLIPWRLRGADDPDTHKRALGSTETAGGASLVGTDYMPDMIDLLRNRALVIQAGAKVYPGLNGIVHFAKKTAAPTVYWMGENPAAGAAPSQPQYGYFTLSPKTLIGTVKIPRQLLTLASIDVENDVRAELGTGTGLAIDLAALHGIGADKQPVGIYSAAGVLSHGVGGAPDYADIIDMPSKVADQNADMGNLSWMTTPLMAGKLKKTPIESGYPTFLWEGDFREGRLGGYTARATSQVSKTLGAGGNEHGLLFGNWADLYVGIWGADLEVVVDVVTLADYGQIKLTSYAMADSGVARGESFCKGTGATV